MPMDYCHLSKHHKIEKQNVAYDRLILSIWWISENIYKDFQLDQL
jgi:hypothetical protein